MFVESADEVFAELETAISQCIAAGVETALSTKKYCPLVETVRAKQGFVGLIYVALSSSSIARERVANRVKRGGHGIADDKIDQRRGELAGFESELSITQNAVAWPANQGKYPSERFQLIASGKLGVLEYVNDVAFPEMKAALSSLPSKPSA